MSPSEETHIVIGAGTTGSATALLLAETGHRVKVISRSGTGPSHPAIELVTGDAADADALRRLTTDADVLYNCANQPYHKWTTDWPPLAASLLDAATSAEAVLVTLDNLYVYAAPTSPMRETDPLQPPSVKGRVRATMWTDALTAHEAGRVRVTEARASDFIGPGVGANGHMGDRVVPKLLAGKSVSLLGNVDIDHSWTAISDVARTLVTIGREERAWGHPWHVPTVAPTTQRQLVDRLCELADVAPVKVKAVPSIALRMAGIFSPPMRELKEMMYQFEQPFVIDSSAATETFGLEATPLDDTLRAAIDSYRVTASA